VVRVHAAGLARGVLHVMTGEPYLMRLMGFGLVKPKNPVLGMDIAGTVTETGARVTRFKVGDEVFGIAKGSYAEYAAAPEDKLALKPKSLTFEQAAAMGISGLTALRALDVARVAAGSSVLVVGASGGVGTDAVQIAVAMGVQPSPALPAAPRPTWSPRSAPNTSSTTPRRTSPTASTDTTWCSPSAE
jgi:NADPH:quinone reductase-like Zn-dependent oxidoreductase